ncbi:MAG: hypothetical protein LBV79_10790 [Candidatus Adiutrix sp.]|jgi:hypothetical protein|nr:hypothetical protein [Candidatus Adiutrix sp.]
MTTFHKTIEVPADRRLTLSLELPDELPPGQAELHVTIFPSPNKSKPAALAAFAGCLKNDASFSGDALEIQREMRDEW